MAKKKGGKAPHGRAKQKQKSQRSASSGSPWAKNTRDDFSYDDDDDEATNVTFRGFGGTTSRSFAAKDPSIKLRHRSIAFVSAGNSRQEQELDETLISAIELNDNDEADMNEQDTGEEEAIPHLDGAMDIEEKDTIEVSTELRNTSAMPLAVPEHETLQFIVDTVGETNTATSKLSLASVEQLLQRATSPTPSDSSDEVILFQGRNKPVVLDDPPTRLVATAIQKSLTEPSVTSASAVHTPPTRPESADEAPPCDWAKKSSTLVPKTDTQSQAWTPAPEGAFWRKSGARNVEEAASISGQAQSSAMGAPKQEETRETIDMLQAAWNQAKREKIASKSAARIQAHVADNANISRRGKRGRKQSNKLLRDVGIEETDVEDAAYQDYLENVAAQDMDGADGLEVQDAVADVDQENEQDWEDTEMTAGDSDESDASDDVIGEDLSDVLDDDDGLDASDLESSELDEELTRAEEEFIRAEEALSARRYQSKKDADIARLWAKQEELCIDADELIIDDGDNLDVDGCGDVEAARAGYEEYIGLSGKRHKSQRSKRRGGTRDVSFPDASAFADTIDQYGNEGFDIMDFDRPSLRPTKKGRKGKMPPELEALSDEELRETTLKSWDNDRDKKRLKKAEREELRSQGLLGALGKKGKADLGQKYQQGMTMDQVYDEIKVFLGDDGKTTQPFPPMDKEDRKALHNVANALNLKSKSVGSGATRYPVLYKTRSTLEVDESTFNRIVRSSTKGFLKNQAWSRGGKKAVKPIKRSGGAGMGATGLRHGEMVGAGAKEIGKENFGHKLMEKMGWTKGMALGRDGEGVLEPIEQMMRVGRAGLG